MRQTWIRVGVGVAAFLVAAAVGIIGFGSFSGAPDPTTGVNRTGADSFALILAIALAIGFVAYAATEYAQTRRFDSISRQFDTRTIVLIPLAIALNIILGQAVGKALQIPIYLDSIGTILVAALAGPIPGALTGFLSNIVWTYLVPPPFQNSVPAAFAIVAAVIGLMAGGFAWAGWLRPRHNRSTRQLAIGAVISVGLILGLAILGYQGFRATFKIDPSLAPQSSETLFLLLGWLAIGLVLGTVIGLLILLFYKRDLTAAYVVVAGVATGLVAALISAPIAANVFGGVTGAGTDFLVAAFRQAGADVRAATLGQGLISDPIDKVTTFFVVYIILSAMSVRTKARFPQGERLLEIPEETA